MTERDLLQYLLEECEKTWYIQGLGWYEDVDGKYMVHLPDNFITKKLLTRFFKSEYELYKSESVQYKSIKATEKLFEIYRQRDDVRLGSYCFANEEPSEPYFSRITIPSLEGLDTAKCQEWCETVYPQNPDLLQEVGGYILFSSDNRFQKMFLVTGPGGNGKGTFLRIMTAILEDHVEGEKLASSIDLDDFGKHERVELVGKQLIYDPDISGSKKAQRWLKIITGGDKITARHLYKSQITFTPTCKVMVLSNPIPDWENSPAMIRRIMLLHFAKRFKIDPTVEASYLTEDMLRKWVCFFKAGYERVCSQNGFSEKAVHNNATEFLSHSDDFSYYLQEYCMVGSDCEIPTIALYNQFKRYWKQELEETKPPINKREFGKKLKEFGVEKVRNKTLSDKEIAKWQLENEQKQRWDIYKGITTRVWLSVS